MQGICDAPKGLPLRNKFINAITQIHIGTRGFFEGLTTALDQARLVLSDEAVTEIAQKSQWHNHPIDIAKLNEDIYFILMDRCEGEAANRVL